MEIQPHTVYKDLLNLFKQNKEIMKSGLSRLQTQWGVRCLKNNRLLFSECLHNKSLKILEKLLKKWNQTKQSMQSGTTNKSWIFNSINKNMLNDVKICVELVSQRETLQTFFT